MSSEREIVPLQSGDRGMYGPREAWGAHPGQYGRGPMDVSYFVTFSLLSDTLHRVFNKLCCTVQPLIPCLTWVLLNKLKTLRIVPFLSSSFGFITT